MVALPDGVREVALARAFPDVLAVGAFLKNAITAIKGESAFISRPLGNLDEPGAVDRFEAEIETLTRALALKPRLIAHDLHPDFYSTRWAKAAGAPAFAVQHHHAHIAAIAAEHRIQTPVLGLALDGFGLGPEACGPRSWGGELLLDEGASFRRLGHFRYLPQPGGDIAAREPWRMAAAALAAMDRGDEIASFFHGQKGAAQMAQVIAKAVNCPPTSSAGRLFDAACGLLGFMPVSGFEGEAPMALEAMVRSPRVLDGGWRIHEGVIDFLPLLSAMVGRPAADGADLFHGTLIAGLADWVEDAARRVPVRHVALGGGCFLNAVLKGGLKKELEKRGFIPLLAERLSPGDAGLSLGQAWIAARVAD